MTISTTQFDAGRKRFTGFLNSELGNNVFVLALLSAVFITSIFYNPPDVPHFTVCIFKSLTGFDCPGCGLTRSFCALSKGNLSRAFYFNKLGPFLYVIFLLCWARALFFVLRLGGAARFVNSALTILPLSKIALVAFVTYWIARTGLHFAGYYI